jgi:hypothetical protein
VLDGASLGSALLTARQRYAEDANELDPVDLKTLAQFTLLGDPAVHPVRSASPTRLATTTTGSQGMRLLRRSRRAKLKVSGEVLLQSKPTASRCRTGRAISPAVRSALASIARSSGVGGAPFRAYPVSVPRLSRATNAKSTRFASRYFVAVSQRGATARSLDLVAVVAKEVGGRIVAYRVYERR